MKKNGWIALIAGMAVVCLCVTLVGGGAATFLIAREFQNQLSDSESPEIGVEPARPVAPTATVRPIVRTPLATPNTTEQNTQTFAAEVKLPKQNLVDLAIRYRGVKPADATVKCERIATGYDIGASRTFTLSNSDTDKQFSITARLEYKTAHVYMWVERSPTNIRLDNTRLRRAADQFEEKIYPTTRNFFGEEASPGVDCDPHLTIVHAAGLGQTVGGYFSSADSFLRAVRDDSNEAEMFVVHAAPGFNGERPNTDTYMSTLAHEFQHMISYKNVHAPDLWLEEGAAQLAERLNGYADGISTVYAFADAPQTQLNTWADSSAGDNSAHYGAGYVFWSYLYDRFGEDVAKKLARSPERSVNAFIALLAAEDIVNPDTNQAFTFEDLFADFVVANFMNQQKIEPAGTRYQYSSIEVPPMSKHAEYRQIDYPVDVKDQVSQFGTHYIELRGDQPVNIRFTGSNAVPLLPLENSDGQFWWSNRADSSNSRLTREIDLSALPKARKTTLNYKAWYRLEQDYDYAYVSASTDNGATWLTLKSATCTTANPQSSNLGCGYTGASGNPDQPTWVDESIDLTVYAGQKFLLRFEMVTDAAVNLEGLAIDDIEIAEINFRDDATTDTGWTAEGFVRADNMLAQQWRVQVILFNKDNSVALERLNLTNSNGTIPVNLGKTVDYAILAISASTQSTTEPGAYQLEIK